MENEQLFCSLVWVAWPHMPGIRPLKLPPYRPYLALTWTPLSFNSPPEVSFVLWARGQSCSNFMAPKRGQLPSHLELGSATTYVVDVGTEFHNCTVAGPSEVASSGRRGSAFESEAPSKSPGPRWAPASQAPVLSMRGRDEQANRRTQNQNL